MDGLKAVDALAAAVARREKPVGEPTGYEWRLWLAVSEVARRAGTWPYLQMPQRDLAAALRVGEGARASEIMRRLKAVNLVKLLAPARRGNPAFYAVDAAEHQLIAEGISEEEGGG